MPEPGNAQWHPISTRVAFTKTGAALVETFGNDGLLAWILLILAARRTRPPGRVFYASDVDFWKELGLYGHEPVFTVEAFLKRTGELKQTSRRRSGVLSEVVLTNYEAWEETTRRQREAERKRRKRAENEADTSRTQERTQTAGYADALRPDPDPDPERSYKDLSQGTNVSENARAAPPQQAASPPGNVATPGNGTASYDPDEAESWVRGAGLLATDLDHDLCARYPTTTIDELERLTALSRDLANGTGGEREPEPVSEDEKWS